MDVVEVVPSIVVVRNIEVVHIVVVVIVVVVIIVVVAVGIVHNIGSHRCGRPKSREKSQASEGRKMKASLC